MSQVCESISFTDPYKWHAIPLVIELYTLELDYLYKHYNSLIYIIN